MDKLRNFWYYYKKHTLIALAALLVIGYLSAQQLGSAKPDYQIGLVQALPLPDEKLAALTDIFTAAGEDLNGDGEVLVQLHPFYVDLADSSENAGVDNAQVVAALDADLVGNVSGIFLLEDVETFRRITGDILADPAAVFDGSLFLTLRRDASEAYVRLAEKLT